MKMANVLFVGMIWGGLFSGYVYSGNFFDWMSDITIRESHSEESRAKSLKEGFYDTTDEENSSNEALESSNFQAGYRVGCKLVADGVEFDKYACEIIDSVESLDACIKQNLSEIDEALDRIEKELSVEIEDSASEIEDSASEIEDFASFDIKIEADSISDSNVIYSRVVGDSIFFVKKVKLDELELYKQGSQDQVIRLVRTVRFFTSDSECESFIIGLNHGYAETQRKKSE